MIVEFGRKAMLVGLLCCVAFVALSSAQTPEIFKRKTIEPRMLRVAKWQLEHPLHEPYDWTNGAFYAGVFAAYETTKSK